MSFYEKLRQSLIKNPKIFLITGVAGFIGSNLLEELLSLNQTVIGLDNFSTGSKKNLEQVKASVSSESWNLFKFIQGDVCNFDDCKMACSNVDYVLHQAALGSVPRSIKDPISSNNANINGFLNMILAAKDARVESFTYAASSSTYGDYTGLPKIENKIGRPLSPYAVTKFVNELYADVFSLNFGFNSIGLRYFNVFGKRQDPNGAYAAVIPKWISSMINGEDVIINGDGKTSRDFCYIENVIQANILAATAKEKFKNQVYNIAVGDKTTLNELFKSLKNTLNKYGEPYNKEPIYRDFRKGDVRHSQADITKAVQYLNYNPEYKVLRGIELAMPWYLNNQTQVDFD